MAESVELRREILLFTFQIRQPAIMPSIDGRLVVCSDDERSLGIICCCAADAELYISKTILTLYVL